jgi:hypothetical protein
MWNIKVVIGGTEGWGCYPNESKHMVEEKR